MEYWLQFNSDAKRVSKEAGIKLRNAFPHLVEIDAGRKIIWINMMEVEV